MNRVVDRCWRSAAGTCLVLALLCAAITATAADTRLEVIELHHRPADELIPLLGPLVGKDGAVTGSGFKLVIRASPGTLAELKKLIGDVDTAPRQLLITVKRETRRQEGRRELEASGSIGIGAGGHVGGPDPAGGGVVVDSARRNHRGQIRLRTTRDREEDLDTQQVRVREGQPAFISLGSSVPVAERASVPGRYGAWVEETVSYRELTTAFRVIAHVSADIVTLDIDRHTETPGREGGGGIDVEHLHTTVSGRLGEWLEIGAGRHERTGHGRGIIYSTAERGAHHGRILVRVEPAPE